MRGFAPHNLLRKYIVFNKNYTDGAKRRLCEAKAITKILKSFLFYHRYRRITVPTLGLSEAVYLQ